MTNKLKYFVGNWKMFGDFSDFKIVQKINKFSYNTKKIRNNKKIILCVPSTLIHYYKSRLSNKHISLGAQNCHHHDNYGPYTGSLSSLMLKKSGAEYIILGHSENRSDGDTNDLIKKKIISSLNQNLNIVFCIGETLVEKKNNKTFSVLKKQLRQSLDKKFNFKKIIISYEPVWSIGTNKIPKISDLRDTIQFVKKECKNIFNTKILPPILYGGSVSNESISLFSSIDEIDGFLIGRASQSSKKFIDIVNNYYK